MGKLAIIAILSLITLLLVISAGCGGGGTSTQNNVSWKTDQVLLEADNFYIVADGQNFYGNDETLDIGSDPGSHHYTTLELEWQEHGVEMRLYIYLKTDDTYWWSDEIRTYDGKQDSNWIYYHGNFFRSKLGSAFKGDIVLKSDPDNDYAGEIHFDKLNLQAFLFNDIKNTIEGYISTFNAGDFNTCLTYFTGYEDEEGALAFLSFIRSLSGELELREVEDIVIVPRAVPGSDPTATVTVVFTAAGEEGTDQMQLRKVYSLWKIVWAEETTELAPTVEPRLYPAIPEEGCLPSTVEVAPELQGVVEVRHCLWPEEGELWEAYQVLNTGGRLLDLTVELYVYDAEGQELLVEMFGGSAGPGSCLGYCDTGSRGAVPLTTTSYRIVVSQ